MCVCFFYYLIHFLLPPDIPFLLRIFSYMIESFNRVKEFVVTLMIRCTASFIGCLLLFVKRTTHIKKSNVRLLSNLFFSFNLTTLYGLCEHS